ncbi:hypothetical protein PMI33_02212, partial [Pseudomonas sp. GM67]
PIAAVTPKMDMYSKQKNNSINPNHHGLSDKS